MIHNITRLSQLNPSALTTALAELREHGHYKSSLSHPTRSAKMFSRWLHRNGHLAVDPLMAVKVPTVATSDKRNCLPLRGEYSQ